MGEPSGPEDITTTDSLSSLLVLSLALSITIGVDSAIFKQLCISSTRSNHVVR